MKTLYVSSFRGQIKVQQMAFVLIAIMVFFSMVALAYYSFRMGELRRDVSGIRDEEAKTLVRKIADSAEFNWKWCSNCIDFDKVLILSNREVYGGFWNIDYLRIEVLYPKKQGVCTKANYPECKTLVIINKSEEFGISFSSFVSLCRKAFKDGTSYDECFLGKVYASGRGLKNG